ncbi:hypothetical protein D918_05257 [Trichuris suis]|nr:hypothetical protein D918_05257 [Trichuris suis]
MERRQTLTFWVLDGRSTCGNGQSTVSSRPTTRKLISLCMSDATEGRKDLSGKADATSIKNTSWKEESMSNSRAYYPAYLHVDAIFLLVHYGLKIMQKKKQL